VRRRGPGSVVVPVWIAAALSLGLLAPAPALSAAHPVGAGSASASSSANGSAVGNFSASLNRIVTLLGVAGSAVLAIAWTRVALSWFSNDVAKKIQAKERARDALIGSLLFVAALSGLLWGLAQWVLTGS
jgi:hypothetical protein